MRPIHFLQRPEAAQSMWFFQHMAYLKFLEVREEYSVNAFDGDDQVPSHCYALKDWESDVLDVLQDFRI